MDVTRQKLDFTGLVLPDYVKTVLEIISPFANWNVIYKSLIEGSVPVEISRQISSHQKEGDVEFSADQWRDLLSLYNNSFDQALQLSDLMNGKDARFDHIRSLVERIQSAPNQDKITTSSLAVKIYSTVCQPNYDFLKDIPFEKTSFTLRDKTQDEIKKFRKDKELNKKYASQLPVILSVLISNLTK